MIITMLYLIVGLVSYPYIARADGIDLQAKEWPYILIAVVIWMVIWLPMMMYKISIGK